MLMGYEPVDLGGVKTYPIADRKNKVVMDRDRAGAIHAGMTVAELIGVLPDQLGSQSLRGVIDAIVAARAKGKLT